MYDFTCTRRPGVLLAVSRANLDTTVIVTVFFYTPPPSSLRNMYMYNILVLMH